MRERIKHFIFKYFSPLMIGRYRRSDGVLLPFTRVSNSTYIGSPEKLNIDDNVFIGHFNFIDASHGLKIGEGCQITNYVSILTHSSHVAIRLYGKRYTDFKQHVGYLTGPVEIGAYTFIGPHSVIMPGSRIGKGGIVSAYSFVKGEYPDFSILAGNPAIIVGDTRDLDRSWLKEHPDLLPFYEQWASENSKV